MLTISDHPLAQEKLGRLRDKRTGPDEFRRLMAESASLLGADILRGVKTGRKTVRTPLGPAPAATLAQPLAHVAVLRAGLGMIPGLLAIAPEAAVGHIGLYRNEETLTPVTYYVRLPKDLRHAFVILCDPMLATGGSAVEALHILKKEGAKRITLLTLLSSKAGVARVHKEHPDVPIHTAGLDPQLNKVGYIVPGLGDAGDRLFGTF